MDTTVEKPLPYKQIFTLCACKFAEPIAFTVIFPFIVFMIREFHMADEAHVGYYVGLITSSFAVAQFATGMPWGMLSDRIGRRPVILNGLFGAGLSVFLMGLSKSFLWALMARMLCGILNGNVGVIKSMMAELTFDYSPAQRARAFSFIPLTSSFGMVLGPIMGGLLSHPVQTYPSIFGRGGWLTDFLTEYPYFLPCFISACICACGFTFGYFFMEETLVRPVKKTTPALSQQNHGQKASYDTFSTHSKKSPSSSSLASSVTVAEGPPTLRACLTPTVLSVILTYMMFNLQMNFYNELLPLWMASERSHGGLGFRTDEIGVALSYSGVVVFIAQLILMPYWTARFGTFRLLRTIMMVLIVLYGCQGFIRYLYIESKTAVWIGLYCALTVRTVCHTIALTSCNLLIQSSAPRRDALGSINGFAQCCASAMKAFGPLASGAIWSAALTIKVLPFNVRTEIVWATLACIGCTTLYTNFRWKEDDLELVRQQKEQQQKKHQDIESGAR